MMIDEFALDTVDFAKILADQTRQEIMALCCCRWVSVGELQGQLGVSQPTVSHHLSVLRSAGLVLARTEGRQVFYRLRQEQVLACCESLADRFNPAPGTGAAGEK